VSEAKSLLEQVSLVCAGRPFYKDVLLAIQRYVSQDLKRLDYSPATLLSNKPKDDPLETILYLTSVGVPSVVYDTVRSLRQVCACVFVLRGFAGCVYMFWEPQGRNGPQFRSLVRLFFFCFALHARSTPSPALCAICSFFSVFFSGCLYCLSFKARAQRLGATQRKLPAIHFMLLYFLAAIELLSFPLLGAGTASLFTDSILTVQATLFGFMAGAVTMTIAVIRELWNPLGGAYNVDGVLQTMVRGLEQETNSRLEGVVFAPPGAGPSAPPSFAFKAATKTTTTTAAAAAAAR